MLGRFLHCKAQAHTMLLYIAHLCQLHVESSSSNRTLTVPFLKACTASRVSDTMMPRSQSLCKCHLQIHQQLHPHLANPIPQLTLLPIHQLEPAAQATAETESVGHRQLGACVQHFVKFGHLTHVLPKSSQGRSEAA